MRTLFSLLFVGSLVFSAGASSENEEIRGIRESCMKDIGITEEIYEEAKKSEEKKAELQEMLKCIDACLLKTLGIMAEDGTLNADKILKMITDSNDKQMAEKRRVVNYCIESKGDTDCETAFALTNCMKMEMYKLQHH